MTRPADGGPGDRALPREAVRRARRRREPAFFAGCWGIFGHGNVAGVGQALLEREHAATSPATTCCATTRPATSRPWCTPSVGYARHRDRLAAFVCHGVGRAGLDQPGHRCRARDRQPDPRAAAARATSSPPGSSNPVLQELEDPTVVRRQRQRLPQAGLALLGPHQPSRAAAAGAARGDAGAHRPGRDRRGHALRCRRTCRPRRGTGTTTCSPRRVWHVARQPVGEPTPSRARPSRASGRRAAAHRRGRRRHLLAGATDALRHFAERDRHTRRRDPGRQGQPRVRPPAVGRRDRRDRHYGRRRARGDEADVVIGVGTRYSDFTTGVAGPSSPSPTCGSSTSTSRRSTRTSCPPCRSSATPALGLEQLTERPGRLARTRRAHAERATRLAARVGRRPSSTPTTSAHGPLPAQSEVIGVVNRLVASAATSWSAPPARCPATCTSCGAPATARATTSSTASPAWATRSPAGSA